MAMRRPRIKPVANIQLNSKRKTKSLNIVKPKVDEIDVNGAQEVEKHVNIYTTEVEKDSNIIETVLETRVEDIHDTTANSLNNDIGNENGNGTYVALELEHTVEVNIRKNHEDLINATIEKDDLFNKKQLQNSKISFEEDGEALNDSEAFKCPPKVGFQRAVSHNTSNSGIDDVFYSDIEENALQMDIEKYPSNNSPTSPSKNLSRQRIRPTPHFGQRRNSFLGSSPSPHNSGNEDSLTISNAINDSVQTTQTRRERHHSASFAGNNHSSAHHFHHTPHKYLPAGITNSSMGRVRTESGCSNFSDTNTSYHKSRKIEDLKQNSRKDFENRFQNGVPEKSAIKMSDLIYYNPVTNPMEQKSKPGVKLEQTETLSNDIKPLSEKLEKETDSLTDSEAVPVPQLKLNAKGELILDDKSLVIETTAEQEARKVLANSSLIYLDENTGMNGFYSRQKRTRDWIPSDTVKFYRCLQNIGTDFSLMVSLFPNRSRRDLKLKFKKEERKNGHLINKALLYPKQFDIESLKSQLNEEEKLREEQTKKAKEKSKKFKKRKVNTSIAKRVLLNEDVYQNENERKQENIQNITNKQEISGELIDQSENGPVSIQIDCVEKENNYKNIHNENEKKTRKRNLEQPNSLNDDEIIVNKKPLNNNANESDNIKKRRRRRKQTPNKVKKEEIIIIKEEIIKVENKQESYETSAETEYQNTKQLQTEINELLDSDSSDNELCSTTLDPPTNASQEPLYIENVNNCTSSDTQQTQLDQNCIATVTDDFNYVQNTFSNLNDDPQFPPSRSQSTSSSSSIICDIENEEESYESAIPEPDTGNNDTCSSVLSERELNEDDIQSILTELAEGSLVLVSTLDPDDPDKVLNEIYMVDKNTGELCEEPLSIPDNIVQCILTVAS